MSRFNIDKLSFLLLSFFIVNCASYKKQYSDSVTIKNKENSEYNVEVDHTFYLIGDAGKADSTLLNKHYQVLQKELKESSENATLLLLGDNIYDKGMPKKEHPERAHAEEILDQQIVLSKNFDGQTIFIPGNHDYYSDGIKGLEREAKYITKALKDKDAFLPRNGCPLEKININENLTLIIVDTQWYLENWNNNPTMNDDCEIKTREQFFLELESLIKKNVNKTTVIAMHHPMFSNGSHGGQFSWKQQLYPANNGVPVPVLGTVINFLRKTSGISPQDMQNALYLDLKERIVTFSQKSDRIVFVSGHEHTLQHIVKDNKPQIISGAGSKSLAVRNSIGGTFSYGGLGYAKLDILKDGTSIVSYFSEDNGERTLLFKTQIFDKLTQYKNESFEFKSFPDSISASIYTLEEVTKKKSFVFYMGEHYRKIYGIDVKAPTVLLDTLYGGLTPTRIGGGMVSRSLRMSDSKGSEYIMRALRKSATQYFQTGLFKNEYIEGLYDDTKTEALMMDFFTPTHPYATFIIGDLSDVVGIYHTNPTLFYVPKQPALKQFNHDFGDELYMIEERAASGHGNKESFGFSNKLISTDDLLKKLRKSDNNYVDEEAYRRARLFDILTGDWDRHQDQWRWAEFDQGNKTMYRPVPRDRDQVFSKFDGALVKIASSIAYEVSKMQVYNAEVTNVIRLNMSGYPMDKLLLTTTNIDDWNKEIKNFQSKFTTDIIDNIFNKLPKEVQEEYAEDIKDSFKGRLKLLPEIIEEYNNHLESFHIVKGNDKDNWFIIDRLTNGQTKITIYNIKDGKKGSKIQERVYDKKATKELWVYGLDDDDIFEVIGEKKHVIPLKLVGGQNHDEYRIESGNKVKMYDFKSKENTFLTKNGKIHLSDNYEMNTYNYKKYIQKRNIILPIIGYNPDDGFKLGVSSILTRYGYNRNPFSRQHTLKAFYYFATNGFDIFYSGEFATILKNWNFYLKAHITSPNYSVNFYGLGNETYNYEQDLDDDDDYHRVRYSTRIAYPSLKWKGRMGGEFDAGVLYESVEVEKTEGRFIETVPNISEERQHYIGLNASYKYENKDSETFPTLGMIATLDTGWKSNLNNDSNFSYITPSLAFAYKLDKHGKVVLATKFKGNIIIGSNYEFYHGASIGGKDGLRGYRNERFTGDKSYYQNTDIRYNIGNYKTSIVPIRVGVFGGFDYGRVWLDGENSNDWKTSYGGGIWIVGASSLNLNFSLFNSKEGNYFKFGLGFEF